MKLSQFKFKLPEDQIALYPHSLYREFENDKGEKFIVEMQNNWTVNFVNRTLCYASKAITNQREKEKSKVKP